MATHRAAILLSKEARHTIQSRTTPTPGPKEVLIQVSSFALNPIDYYSRDFGFAIKEYPAVVGSDVGGTIASVGSSVSAFKKGDRVAAFANAFYTQGSPSYGAFQELVLVPSANVTPIPSSLTFDDATTLGMSVITSFSGLYSIGVPFNTSLTADEKRGFLVWGAASSVGTGIVQIAKSMGYIVFATAGAKHHEYLKGLGADHCFDYSSPTTVSEIVETAKKGGVSINEGYRCIGDLALAMQVLHSTSSSSSSSSGKAKLASAPPLTEEEKGPYENVEVKFVSAPEGEEEKEEHFSWVFNGWLKGMLEEGKWKIAPKVRVLEGGLGGVDGGLDELKGGVSGVKLVLRV